MRLISILQTACKPLLPACLFMLFLSHSSGFAADLVFNTSYMTLVLDNSGNIVGMTDKISGTNYSPKGETAPILTLFKGAEYIKPSSFTFNAKKKTATLKYPNGSVAMVKIEEKGDYVRFELLSVEPRNGIEVAMWGPYQTTISKLIGETIGVVRDDNQYH
jgi:hypothetical protein